MKRILLMTVWLISCVLTVQAQKELIATEVGDTLTVSAVDSVSLSPVLSAKPDSSVKAVLQAADSIKMPVIRPVFKPNPTKAVLFSAIFPGLGQIYNRKYWKLPLVYGGFMGCIYAVTWNNRNYKDYSLAYKDIMSDDPMKHPSWQNFIPAGASPESYAKDSQFKERLKRQKDYFRRYRDLSIIITAGLYVLCMVDAYVDAQLFDFDISPDLSMHVEPAMTQPTSFSSRTYGVNCSLKF
ncbi:MAG: DUF5683 domain-containing protein [Tannerellaceae bacterium]